MGARPVVWEAGAGGAKSSNTREVKVKNLGSVPQASVCKSMRSPLLVAESKVDGFDQLTWPSMPLSSYENPRESSNPFIERLTTAGLRELMKESNRTSTEDCIPTEVSHRIYISFKYTSPDSYI